MDVDFAVGGLPDDPAVGSEAGGQLAKLAQIAAEAGQAGAGADETHLNATPGKRRMLAAAAGRSGAGDISVRIEQIIEGGLAR